MVVAAVHLTVDDFEWLDEDTCRQVGGIDDCQRLQQPVCGALLVATPIPSQHGHRQSIADPPSYAQRPEEVYIDDESVRGHDWVTDGRCRRETVGRLVRPTTLAGRRDGSVGR